MDKLEIEIMYLEAVTRDMRKIQADAELSPALRARMMQTEIDKAEASLRGLREMTKAAA